MADEVRKQVVVEIRTEAEARQLDEFVRKMRTVGPEAQRAGTSMAGLGSHMRSVRNLAQGLAFEFPILGRALKFLTNPVTLLAAGVAVAVDRLKQWIDAQKKAAQELAWTIVLRQQQAEVARLDVRLDQALKRIKQASEALGRSMQAEADAVSEANAEIDRQLKLTEDLAKAKDELAKSDVARQLAEGKITPEKAARLIGGIEQQAAGRASATAIEAQQRRVAVAREAFQRGGMVPFSGAGVPTGEQIGAAQIRLKTAEAELSGAPEQTRLQILAKQREEQLTRAARPIWQQALTGLEPPEALIERIDEEVKLLEGQLALRRQNVDKAKIALVTLEEQAAQIEKMNQNAIQLRDKLEAEVKVLNDMVQRQNLIVPVESLKIGAETMSRLAEIANQESKAKQEAFDRAANRAVQAVQNMDTQLVSSLGGITNAINFITQRLLQLEQQAAAGRTK